MPVERLSPEERGRVETWQRDPFAAETAEREAEHERTTDRRLWAAVLLTRDVEVCRSIASGRPVLARKLDGVVLRRALRGAPLPPPDEYIVVDADMLDAAAEGGAFK
jgi:hypothetical protein